MNNDLFLLDGRLLAVQLGGQRLTPLLTPHASIVGAGTPRVPTGVAVATAAGIDIKGPFTFQYPPTFLLATSALALLPYPAAMLLWISVGLPLYLFAVRLIFGTWNATLAALACSGTPSAMQILDAPVYVCPTAEVANLKELQSDALDPLDPHNPLTWQHFSSLLQERQRLLGPLDLGEVPVAPGPVVVPALVAEVLVQGRAAVLRTFCLREILNGRTSPASQG